MKKPWLAAALNLVPLGLGYLYLGRPARFAATLFGDIWAAAMGFGIFILIVLAALGPALSGGDTTAYEQAALALSPLPLLLVALFTAWNAWGLADEHNAALQAANGGAGTPGSR